MSFPGVSARLPVNAKARYVHTHCQAKPNHQ